MKLLIFSDVHGNYNSLKYLEAAINKIVPDKIFFLGDVFGYYYEYKEVIKFLKRYNIKCILGNHDQMAMNILFGEVDNLTELAEKYGSGYNHILSSREFYLEYLCHLDTRHEEVFNNQKILMVHGSPSDELNGRVYPSTHLEISDWQDHDLYFCGHTHHRSINVLEKSTVINVGSLGQPRDGLNPSFVVYDTENFNIRYFEVPKDQEYCYYQLEKNNDLDKAYSSILKRTVSYDNF
jgi:putative phosphoesterase